LGTTNVRVGRDGVVAEEASTDNALMDMLRMTDTRTNKKMIGDALG
jgi:hypothetical protein